MGSSLRYISLFSGAGGLDIGLECAGFKAISLCEIEPSFVETLKVNRDRVHKNGKRYFQGSRLLNSDICNVKGSELSDKAKADLVVGGPPCQSFSSSGKQKSILDDRGLLVHQFIRIVEELKPRTFLFENVRGLVTARDERGEPGGVIRKLLDKFSQIGYSCRTALLNSADYGAFQRRVRCFIVGSRNGTAPLFPEPTHSKEGDMFLSKWKSLRAFLEKYADSDESNYTYPTETLEKELQQLPNGSGLKSKGKAEATRPGGHWGYRQGTFIADLDLPARTVTGSSSQDWVRWEGRLRRLTLNEVKRLQGFPDDWDLCGTKAQKFKQVGNAVPVTFGEILGKRIFSFLEDYPLGPPVKIDIPKSFKNYINYTKRDHERNVDSRTVHRQFDLG